MNISYKTNSNVCYSCKYHIIWCTKYRRNILSDPKIANRLRQIIEDFVETTTNEIIELVINEDHVHLLVECDPQYGIHFLVKRLKGLSSHHLRKEFSETRTRVPTLWTNSYFCSTTGGATIETIKQYIENQKLRNK